MAEDRPDTKLAKMVRAKRAIENVSQGALAERLKVGRGTVSRVETGGQLTRLAAQRFADWLGVSTDRVLQFAKEVVT